MSVSRSDQESLRALIDAKKLIGKVVSIIEKKEGTLSKLDISLLKVQGDLAMKLIDKHLPNQKTIEIVGESIEDLIAKKNEL